MCQGVAHGRCKRVFMLQQPVLQNTYCQSACDSIWHRSETATNWGIGIM